MVCEILPPSSSRQDVKWKTSPYFDRIIFQESLAADQVLEEKSDEIFASRLEDSFLDIDIRPGNADNVQINAMSEADNGQQHTKSGAASTAWYAPEDPPQPSTPVDTCSYPGQKPPNYVARLGLCLETIVDSAGLKKALQDVDSENSWRMCFIRQRHSYSRLSVTRELFETLTSCLGVFPKFRDFILLFGMKQEESEMSLPPLRFRPQTQLQEAADIGWNGEFECAYALRYVELNNRDTSRPWSIRQVAVYHNYSRLQNSSTWILVSAPSQMETCIDRYVKSVSSFQEVDPFELHVLILESVLTNWRPYIMYLAEKISRSTNLFSVASIDDGHPIASISIDARQILNDTEDEVIDIMSVLESTKETVDALHEIHEPYCLTSNQRSDPHEQDCRISLCKALRQTGKEIVINQKQVSALQNKLKGTKELLSSLLDLDNGISLKRLAHEAAEESGNMRRLTEKSTQDAATVKMLTVITIIYLPATAISNFFSTEFVSLNSGNHVVELSSNAWLFAALTFPLTLVTFIIWWIWMLSQNNPVDNGIKNKMSPLTKILTHRRTSRNDSRKDD